MPGFFRRPTAYTAYNVQAKIITISPLFNSKLSNIVKFPELTTTKTAIKVIKTPSN